MSTLSKLFLIFALALSVSSMATPHAARSLGGHHALAARKAAPAPALPPYGDELKVVKPKKLRRRSNSSRCAANSSSIVSSATVVSSVSLETSSAAASSSPAVAVGVAANPSPEPSPSSSPATHAATTTQAAPTPTPTPAKTTPSSSEQAPSSTAAASSATQTGDATFYAVGLGACGVTNVPTDMICAVSEDLFDTFPGYNRVNPNTNPVCGKTITATYQGKSVTVKVQDRCTGCAFGSLDFSTSAFDVLGLESVGRLTGMTWSFDD